MSKVTPATEPETLGERLRDLMDKTTSDLAGLTLEELVAMFIDENRGEAP